MRGIVGCSHGTAKPSIAQGRVQMVASLQEQMGCEPQGAIPPAIGATGRLCGQSSLTCLAQQVFAVCVRHGKCSFWRDHEAFPFRFRPPDEAAPARADLARSPSDKLRDKRAVCAHHVSGSNTVPSTD